MSYITPQQLYETGLAHHGAGRTDEAQRAYRQVLVIDPRHADALHMLGILEQQAGRHQRGFELITAAIGIDASPAEFHYNLGNSLLHLNRVGAAADAFAAAVARNPDLFEARKNLGAALMLDGRANEAAEVFAAALRQRPDAADVHNNFGLALRDIGDIERAVASFARAIELKPSYPAAWDNYLYALHYHPSYDAAAIGREHAKWACAMTQALRPREVSFANDRSPDRKLRIGYVSPNFREHPVGRALLPLLENHDRARFEVVCYSDADAHGGDSVAQRLKRCADRWQATAGMDDTRFAELVREHRLDVLVDPTLHMTGNRLLAFARRAAPVQVSFIGYPATSGLPEMDYRITDPWLDPPTDAADQHNVEKLVRLTRTFWCYDTRADDDLPVSPPPALRSGAITFGSLNSAAKVTQPVLDTWAEILTKLPSSRLILFANERTNPGEHLRREFARRGVAGERLTFLPRVPRRQYLQQYAQIDIALDPWPYTGHMTTCDALWMGVPAVSLIGQTSVARAGLSLLSAVGLEELLATSRGRYIQLAIELANDVARLAELRAMMRQRITSSPLADGKSFAREVESIYRELWGRWCEANATTGEGRTA
jgi:protein O-GlcNAc transferase